MNEYYSFDRQEIMAYISPNPKKVLDVGCAAGIFGTNLKDKFGCEVTGIEPVKSICEVAGEKLDKVINALFTPELNLPENKFDAIFFNDVLEHMSGPQESLLYAHTLLNTDGVVYASIPNFIYFNNIYSLIKTKDWKYADAGILDSTHMRFFTRKSMIRMFTDCNFKINEIHGINPTNNSKFLFLHRLFPRRLDDFLYTQYFIKARPVK